jgi:hypothetical protein
MKIVKEYRERADNADDLAKTASSDEQRRRVGDGARKWPERTRRKFAPAKFRFRSWENRAASRRGIQV